MQDSTFMQLMRVLPKSALSTVVGHLTRAKAPASMHHAAIRWFAKRYDVQLDEAEKPVEGYPYIPGEFWPVNPASVSLKASLFAVNERLVTYMRTTAGRVAVVKVGATNVSRIRAAYDDIVTHNNKPGVVHSYEQPKPVEK